MGTRNSTQISFALSAMRTPMRCAISAKFLAMILQDLLDASLGGTTPAPLLADVDSDLA